MIGLDVGLLGTAPIDDPRAASSRSRPPDTSRDRPHATAAARPARRGTAVRSRRARSRASPPGQPYHVADQARRIGTGRPRGRLLRGRVRSRPAPGDVRHAVPPRAAPLGAAGARRSPQTRTSSAPYLDDLASTVPLDTVFGPGSSPATCSCPEGIGGDPRDRARHPLCPSTRRKPCIRSTRHTGARPRPRARARVRRPRCSAPIWRPPRSTTSSSTTGSTRSRRSRGGISRSVALRGELDGFVARPRRAGRPGGADREAGTAGPLIERLNGGQS